MKLVFENPYVYEVVGKDCTELHIPAPAMTNVDDCISITGDVLTIDITSKYDCVNSHLDINLRDRTFKDISAKYIDGILIITIKKSKVHKINVKHGE